VVAVIGGPRPGDDDRRPAGAAPGEALLADRSGVSGWRNIGQRAAALFWVIGD
jgi:hypothetical protein